MVLNALRQTDPCLCRHAAGLGVPLTIAGTIAMCSPACRIRRSPRRFRRLRLTARCVLMAPVSSFTAIYVRAGRANALRAAG